MHRKLTCENGAYFSSLPNVNIDLHYFTEERPTSYTGESTQRKVRLHVDDIKDLFDSRYDGRRDQSAS